MHNRIRMGMIGGGKGAFIGAIHRMAASLDGEVELVAGCFSSDPALSRSTGLQLGLADKRSYTDYRDMIRSEAALAAEQRMEFVTIVTPNDLHLPVATEALKNGFHVLSDKPATRTLEEAILLKKAVTQSALLYELTHTYCGYPMVVQARKMVRSGQLGAVRRVAVAYPQGWLSAVDDSKGSKQASWRLNPERAGKSGCFGDIATHAHNLVEFITGLRVTAVCADIRSVVNGRVLDDDGAALLNLEHSARGTLMASQVCAGEGNNMNISIYCEQGSLFWQQETPNQLEVKRRNRPVEIYQAGANNEILDEEVRALCRTPQGHPEGYIEAFANIYRNFAARIRLARRGVAIPTACVANDINAGVRGMAFVRGVIESSKSQASWVSLAPLWQE